MSDFLDKMGKAVNETAKQAIKISGDMVEFTKTTLNIKFDEVKRESFFKEIGKITYAAYKLNPNAVDPAILDYCKCIDEIDDSIREQKVKAASLKNKKYCVVCGKKLTLNMLYCPYCGANQPILDEDEDEECCGCGEDDCECGEDDCECGGEEESEE